MVRLGVDSPDGMDGNGVAGLPYAQEGPSAGKPSHTHGGRGHPKPEVQVAATPFFCFASKVPTPPSRAAPTFLCVSRLKRV